MSGGVGVGVGERAVGIDELDVECATRVGESGASCRERVDAGGDREVGAQSFELVAEHPVVEGKVVGTQASTVQPYRDVAGDVGEGGGGDNH